MIFLILSCVEVFLQMYLGIGLYLRNCEQRRGRKKWQKAILYLILLGIFCIEVYDKQGLLVSWGSILLDIILEGVWLWYYAGERHIKIFAWIFFVRWTIGLLDMVVVIVSSFRGGIFEGIGANMNPDICTKGIECALLFTILILCRHKQVRKEPLFRNMLLIKDSSLFFLGTVEFIFIFYLMNVIWKTAQSADLILNLVLLICVFFVLVVQILRQQYLDIENTNALYRSKERMLEQDYGFLRQEMDKTRKAVHDFRYDISYLYECLEEENYRKGISYIEQKQKLLSLSGQIVKWTGYYCVDSVISQKIALAKQESVVFKVYANVTALPIPEYDFFAMIGNLLDNAVEAAEQCRKEERWVDLKLQTANNIFLMMVKNSYAAEPIEKRGRFVSSKKEGENHGWGIMNVKEIVERNGGRLQIEYGNGIFLVRITFGNGGNM